jgi:branched-chain amino acid transport system substrate-binding protein
MQGYQRLQNSTSRFVGWRAIAKVAAAAGMMLALATTSHAETVKIGLIAPFSGGYAIWGSQFQQAIEAFQAVNGKSVNGNDIEVVYRDDGGPDPVKAKQLAEELILRDQVKYLAGFAFTPNLLAVADLATQTRTPTIILNAATASATRNSPMFVRLSMTLPQQTAPLAQWAAANGIKKVYTLVADYAPGHDAEAQFAKTFQAAGGEIIGQVQTPLSTVDFSAFMEKALLAKPDALFLFEPAGAASIAAVSAWAQRGLRDAGIQLLATGETQEIFLRQIGDPAVGAISAQHYSLDLDNPQNALLKSTLAKMFGDQAIPDIASVAAWDGMRLIYDAVSALGPDADGKAVIDFIAGRKLESPRGSITIDPQTRDIIQNIYVRKVVKDESGQLVNKTIATIDQVKDPWKQDNP